MSIFFWIRWLNRQVCEDGHADMEVYRNDGNFFFLGPGFVLRQKISKIRKTQLTRGKGAVEEDLWMLMEPKFDKAIHLVI